MTKQSHAVDTEERGLPSRHILVIDDEPDVCELFLETARGLGLTCCTAGGEQIIGQKLRGDLSLIFVDLIMPGVDGIEVLRFLANCNTSAGIVVMSGIGSRVIESAVDLGNILGLNIIGSLEKPFHISDLEALLQTIPITPALSKRPNSTRLLIRESDLIAAVELDQFVLHYQPQIQIGSGKVVGVEALIRWNHPAYDLVFPDDFIPLAQELNLIDRITWIVLEKGLRDKPAFNETLRSVPRLSINIAASSLHHLKFPEMVSSRLAQFNVRPDELVLEITESGLVDDLVYTLDVLSRLRVRGVNLSIDDFGTGYSMMRQLRSIPATELKIDKAFVAGMATKTSDRIMVQKTIEIGHELGMSVVAEGVETAEHLEALCDDGCDIAQGYYFTRPLPLKEFRDWLLYYRSQMR
jgi:EAL domain-containing protein (putative c-di-GMP-specific phosphodiesterase class I)/CheY-like chemotaxis protein